mmetsp:Transcript_31486/g.77981  ORF Transcript_31486/g.77981 Transcript_31486/m.77981 type:complete len:271 (+) Transcript_31486:128-940(+)
MGSTSISSEARLVRQSLWSVLGKDDDASEEAVIAFICETIVEELKSRSVVLIDDITALVESLLLEGLDETDRELSEICISQLASDGVLAKLGGENDDDDEAAQVGDECQAIMKEDGEWHGAVVERLPDDKAMASDRDGEALYTVRFSQYGNLQRTRRSDLRLHHELADDGDTEGECELCLKRLPLTKHHVIPRSTHAHWLKKGMTQQELSQGIMICRPCHDVTHRIADHMTLATQYRTVDQLRDNEVMRKWLAFAQKGRGGTRQRRASRR